MQGYLGIDAGTQGLSVTFTDETMQVIATGDGHYEMVPGLADGEYEQRPENWEAALTEAMQDLRKQLDNKVPEWSVQAIGISGQMHGEVTVDAAGKPLGAARLWCDARNEDEGQELTQLLGIKMPKRLTATRWLWTLRNRADRAAQTHFLTTPGGWLAYCLTGEKCLGIGDASGMFPVDPATGTYDCSRLETYERHVAEWGGRPLSELLPRVCAAGQAAGALNAHGAELTGLPEGIPVAPAEGDQPAALAGSLIGDTGMVSISLGTSVCANAVGDHEFEGVHPGIDHFCAADGKPINMVWLRNGTTYMNLVVNLFAGVLDGKAKSGFKAVIPQVLAAAPDCGGIIALPFVDDEPGVQINRGGTALLVGLTPTNATPGNVVKAALLATLFNLRLGMDELSRQRFARTELVLSGGLVRDPELGQIVADVLGAPAVILDSATEGSGWGAALLAGYRDACRKDASLSWSDFLKQYAAGTAPQRFEPDPSTATQYDRVFMRYQQVLKAQNHLEAALHNDIA